MDHREKVLSIQKEFKKLKSSKQPGYISLKPKATSHFFRKRKKGKKLDMLSLTDVLSVSKKDMTAEVEGLVSFKKLSEATLKHGLIPLVVPELRNITVGGTIAGLGVEASSFKYGLVHHTVTEYEVLTGNGEVITCSKDKNSDLFYSLPNSLATFGYVTKATIKLRPASKDVHLKLHRFEDVSEYVNKLRAMCNDTQIDFIDSVIYGPNDFLIVEGRMINKLPEGKEFNDFKTDVYWKYLKDWNDHEAFLTFNDFLWRWDTDVFWCLSGRSFFSNIVESRIFRKSFGKAILRSDTLEKLQRLKAKFASKENHGHESVLQDLGLNLNKLGEFMEWYKQSVGIFPMWVCPSKNINPEKYPMNNFKGAMMLDVGIYTGKKLPKGAEPHYYTKLLEKKAVELSGHKGLYSLSFYTEDAFWKLYSKEKYFATKKKYDTDNVLPNMFQKAVGERTL